MPNIAKKGLFSAAWAAWPDGLHSPVSTSIGKGLGHGMRHGLWSQVWKHAAGLGLLKAGSTSPNTLS